MPLLSVLGSCHETYCLCLPEDNSTILGFCTSATGEGKPSTIIPSVMSLISFATVGLLWGHSQVTQGMTPCEDDSSYPCPLPSLPGCPLCSVLLSPWCIFSPGSPSHPTRSPTLTTRLQSMSSASSSTLSPPPVPASPPHPR